MKNITKVLLLIIVGLSAAFFSGCSSESVTPKVEEFGPIMRANRPIPVAVGVVFKGLNWDYVKGFKSVVLSGFDDARIFHEIYVKENNVTVPMVEIVYDFKITYPAFSSAYLKILFGTMTLGLGHAIVSYETDYELACSINLMKNGVKLKTYSARGHATNNFQSGARGMKSINPDAIASVSKQVQVDLMNQLLNDRSFLEHELVRIDDDL